MPAIAPSRVRRLALILLGAAVWMWPTSLTAADVLQTTVTVRVYQTAGLPPALEQRALAEAETVLRFALVDVRWRKCTSPGVVPPTACVTPPGPSELALRILREGAPRHHTSVPLGDAIVRRGGGGVLATVYFNHVAWLADKAGADPVVLLGRAVAHELGHLLMRTPSHQRQGLMRPSWTPIEVRRNRAADWAFTPGDVAAIHQPAPRY